MNAQVPASAVTLVRCQATSFLQGFLFLRGTKASVNSVANVFFAPVFARPGFSWEK